MNFHGAARPLHDGDVVTIAGYLGCHIAAVRAVLAVEARGKGFGTDGRPIILNEPHVFYRELRSTTARASAVQSGLAYQKWGEKPYPRTQALRYAWLEKAMQIDETAALKSCSWGLAQVMGFNHRACGFPTVQSFVIAMTQSEGAQLYAMARFIVSNGLQKHLRSLNWASFARGYNGAGYAKNNYDSKLRSAYLNRPKSERFTPPPATEAQLQAMVSPVERREPIDLPDEHEGKVIFSQPITPATDVKKLTVRAKGPEKPAGGSGTAAKTGAGIGGAVAGGAVVAVLSFWERISEWFAGWWPF